MSGFNKKVRTVHCHWMYLVTFATDIECGIQIFWTVNHRAVSQWKIVKEEKDCGFLANNFSLGNGSVIHGSKNLNATFNGKSNWVPLRWITKNEKMLRKKKIAATKWTIFHWETALWFTVQKIWMPRSMSVAKVTEYVQYVKSNLVFEILYFH